MGSDGTASPTEQRDGSNAKKRFGQADMSTAEAMANLEAGVLKLERDSPTGSGGLYPLGNNEIEARMPLRARLQELATFVAWFALIASCTMQYPMVWVAFWNHVEALRVHMYSFHRRSVSLPLWGLWVAALFCYRRMIYRRVTPDLGALLLHAEVFACVVLCMTGEWGSSCNTATCILPKSHRLGYTTGQSSLRARCCGRWALGCWSRTGLPLAATDRIELFFFVGSVRAVHGSFYFFPAVSEHSLWGSGTPSQWKDYFAPFAKTVVSWMSTSTAARAALRPVVACAWLH